MFFARRIAPDRIEVSRYPDGAAIGVYDASDAPLVADCGE